MFVSKAQTLYTVLALKEFKNITKDYSNDDIMDLILHFPLLHASKAS